MFSAHLAQQPALVDLPAVHADAQARLLAVGLGQRGWKAASRGADVCPFIAMTGRSWDRYVASLGREHRANFKRRLRKLQQEHGMRLERASTDEARSNALGTLIQLHNERWAPKGGSTAFHSLDLVMFHRDVSALALERGWLRLYVLWVDDEPAAALYGFARNGKFYFYQAGFNTRFSHLSVGLVLMGLAIREAFAEGLVEYDLLHGDERYKFLWASDARSLNRLELYPPEMRGALYHTAVHAYRRTRGVAGQLIRATRRALGASKEVTRARPPVVVPSAH
jgi:CelD/BcsL family acetyltransferase involved in cellulose biosynthesis